MDWLFVVARMGRKHRPKVFIQTSAIQEPNTGQKIQHTPWCETPLMINSMFPTTMSDCTGSTTQHLSMMHWACSHHCPIWVCSSVPRFPGWAPMDSTSGKNGGGPSWANSSINMIFVLANWSTCSPSQATRKDKPLHNYSGSDKHDKHCGNFWLIYAPLGSGPQITTGALLSQMLSTKTLTWPRHGPDPCFLDRNDRPGPWWWPGTPLESDERNVKNSQLSLTQV